MSPIELITITIVIITIVIYTVKYNNTYIRRYGENNVIVFVILTTNHIFYPIYQLCFNYDIPSSISGSTRYSVSPVYKRELL